MAHLRSHASSLEPLFFTSVPVHGVAARMGAHQLQRLLAESDLVHRIHPLPPVHPLTSSSVPFVEALEAWSAVNGGTGRTVRVGVVDTGIDYLHRDFGGPGQVEHDPDVVGEGLFPTVRVVDGWDFVGDAYDGTNAARPDPDPMDCIGHGTHVAGLLAGSGVTSDGQTYSGPWNEATPVGDMSLGPGVAPEVELVALKIFGCSGSSDYLLPAIEWAMDPNGDGDTSDHLDILNLSLGASYGSAEDIYAQAIQAATDAGVLVVAAAGNSGDGFYAQASPGVASHAVSVAASRDDGLVYDAVRVEAPAELAGEVPGAMASFTPSPGPSGPEAPLMRASPPHACTDLDNGSELDGAVALLDWIGCSAEEVMARIELAGAVGAVFIAAGQDLPFALSGETGSVGIPAIMIGRSDGEVLADALPGVSVSFADDLRGPRPELADTVAYLSSRGPRMPDAMLKPDISAPGDRVRGPDAGTDSGGVSGTGTSAACPHVAGAAAILRQAHPDWSPLWIKAALMGTATHDLVTDSVTRQQSFGPGRQGAGRLDLAAAINTPLVAFAAEPEGAVSVSFGRLEVVSSHQDMRTVTVHNTSGDPVVVDISLEEAFSAPGVMFDVAPDLLEIPSGGSRSVSVTIDVQASELRHTIDPSLVLHPSGGSLSRHWLTEGAAWLELEPSTPGAATVRLPVHAAVRPVSEMATARSSLTMSRPTRTVTFQVSGTGIDAGTVPPGIRSTAQVFELHGTSPNEAVTGPDLDRADLAFVGVSSDRASRTSMDETVLAFAIVTHREWNSPSTVWFEVWIDTDLDGEDDVLLYPASLASPDRTATDIVWSRTWTPATSKSTWELPLQGVAPDERYVPTLDTNAMVMLVKASSLGLDEGARLLSYRVVASAVVSSSSLEVDRLGPFAFDPSSPGVGLPASQTMPAFWDDLDGEEITVQLNAASLIESRAKGILLLHHHNRSTERAQVITVVPRAPRRPAGSAVSPPPELGASSRPEHVH